MLIYGNNINNSEHNDKITFAKQDKFIKYKIGNINIKIKYDYDNYNNFYTSGNLSCILYRATILFTKKS